MSATKPGPTHIARHPSELVWNPIQSVSRTISLDTDMIHLVRRPIDLICRIGEGARYWCKSSSLRIERDRRMCEPARHPFEFARHLCEPARRSCELVRHRCKPAGRSIRSRSSFIHETRHVCDHTSGTQFAFLYSRPATAGLIARPRCHFFMDAVGVRPPRGQSERQDVV
jgi:hypothetical protein